MTPQEYAKSIVTISKEGLAALPAAEYKGNIHVVDTPEKLAEALSQIKKAGILGFDTETRPSFRRGVVHKVALIQLSTEDSCYLFRTNKIGFPDELLKILENPDIQKIGLSIHDDFHNLRRNHEIEPQGFVDLQNLVKEFKIADISLSKIYGILFDERISKTQRLSNWEASELTPAQQAYAALDAYACVRIYEYLKSGEFNPANSKYLTLPPEPSPIEDSEHSED